MMTRRDYPDTGEALYSAVLPNGLQVLVCPRPGYAKGLAFFATKYGGAMRRFTLDGRAVDTPAGVAHFLEHKMFDLPEGNALAMLSQRGARANAFTSSGITAYHFDCTEGFSTTSSCSAALSARPISRRRACRRSRASSARRYA